ncbi:MAG: glycosyltransferase family 2 protein [Deltaproteobacteria bacterium]|nr:glycosyltransferase family 2 protein [Deltaproteobacteria bacterium]MBW2094939.1 glycosyltransferase family 2 protein [Deltaproteobacteria bacterium]
MQRSIQDVKPEESRLEREGISIIIPAFNEKEGIGIMLEGLKEAIYGLDVPKEIIVIDDGSSDGTSEVLKSIEGIRVFTHKRNKGYGASIKTGMKNAVFEWICIMDADGTYPPDRIPDLVKAAEGMDMVVGARVLRGAKVPMFRKPAKWILTQLANYLAQDDIPDLNSGLRIFKKEVAKRFEDILSDRFSFTTTITLAMLCNNYKVAYVPITYSKRKGKSKIRPIHDTLGFLQLIVRTILYFDPLRIFLPIGTCLLLTSVALFILRLIQGGGYAVTIPMFLLSGIQVLAIGMLADLIDRRIK